MFGKLREKFSAWLKKEKKEEKAEPAKKSKKASDETVPARSPGIVSKNKGKKEIEEEKVKKDLENRIMSAQPEKTEKVEKKEQLVDVEAVVAEKEELVEEEKTGFFGRLKKKLTESELTQTDFDEVFEELEMTLLENNVALQVVEKIHDSLSKDLVSAKISKKKTEETIVGSLKDAVLEVLVDGEDVVSRIEKSDDPFVILFFGINGSGKTTTVAKFASLLKEKGISCVLGAGDTFRAASIEQLETHAKNLGVPIVKSDYGADPASVAFDAIKYAKAHKKKVVLIDTAGRMYTQGNLMREMEKIARVANPDLKIFVGESITGNDAVSQAKSFSDSIGIDGVILSKADIDEKAGTILSVGFVTGKPILYLGVGQEYGDLKRFRKEDVLKNLGLD